MFTRDVAPGTQDSRMPSPPYSLFKQPISFPRRVFAPGFCFFASLTPMKGWAERRESSGACEAPVGPARNAAGQAPGEAPCVPYGGRSPPGALTVAILGSG